MHLFEFSRETKNFGIREFFDSLESNSNCVYKYIGEDEFRQWEFRIQKECRHKNCITIGTRPPKLGIITEEHLNVKLNRIMENNGATHKIVISEEEKKSLRKFIAFSKDITVVEDVCVTGSTLDFLFTLLEEFNFSGRIRLFLFAANKNSINTMLAKHSFISNVEIHIPMHGNPIIESTLLCCFDMFYSRLGTKMYKDQVKLMETFFLDKTRDFLNIFSSS